MPWPSTSRLCSVVPLFVTFTVVGPAGRLAGIWTVPSTRVTSTVLSCGTVVAPAGVLWAGAQAAKLRRASTASAASPHLNLFFGKWLIFCRMEYLLWAWLMHQSRSTLVIFCVNTPSFLFTPVGE